MTEILMSCRNVLYHKHNSVKRNFHSWRGCKRANFFQGTVGTNSDEGILRIGILVLSIPERIQNEASGKHLIHICSHRNHFQVRKFCFEGMLCHELSERSTLLCRSRYLCRRGVWSGSFLEKNLRVVEGPINLLLIPLQFLKAKVPGRQN